MKNQRPNQISSESPQDHKTTFFKIDKKLLLNYKDPYYPLVLAYLQEQLKYHQAKKTTKLIDSREYFYIRRHDFTKYLLINRTKLSKIIKDLTIDGHITHSRHKAIDGKVRVYYSLNRTPVGTNTAKPVGTYLGQPVSPDQGQPYINKDLNINKDISKEIYRASVEAPDNDLKNPKGNSVLEQVNFLDIEKEQQSSKIKKYFTNQENRIALGIISKLNQMMPSKHKIPDPKKFKGKEIPKIVNSLVDKLIRLKNGTFPEMYKLDSKWIIKYKHRPDQTGFKSWKELHTSIKQSIEIYLKSSGVKGKFQKLNLDSFLFNGRVGSSWYLNFLNNGIITNKTQAIQAQKNYATELTSMELISQIDSLQKERGTAWGEGEIAKFYGSFRELHKWYNSRQEILEKINNPSKYHTYCSTFERFMNTLIKFYRADEFSWINLNANIITPGDGVWVKFLEWVHEYHPGLRYDVHDIEKALDQYEKDRKFIKQQSTSDIMNTSPVRSIEDIDIAAVQKKCVTTHTYLERQALVAWKSKNRSNRKTVNSSNSSNS